MIQPHTYMNEPGVENEDEYLDGYWESRYDFDVADYGPEDFRYDAPCCGCEDAPCCGC